MRADIPHSFDRRIVTLQYAGLSACAEAILINCMVAEKEGRGTDNRAFLIGKIKRNTPANIAAALKIYDDYCAAGFSGKLKTFKSVGV